MHILSRLSIGEIADICGGRVVGAFDGELREFATDSRKVEATSLFFAIRGERFDGHDFVSGLSCGAAVVERAQDCDICQIVVGDSAEAMGKIARRLLEMRRELSPFCVYALTGSNGKTTTKEFLAAILEASGAKILKTSGNFNNQIGLPLVISALRSDHDCCVLELGASEPGDIEELSDIARADCVGITCVSEAHLAGFGSLEGVAAEKGKILSGAWVKRRVLAEALKSYYSSSGADIVWVGEEYRVEGLDFSDRYAAGFAFDLAIPGDAIRIEPRFFGAHNAQNFALACAMAGPDIVTREVVSRAARDYALPSGRLECLHFGRTLLLNDAYNANPASMRAALRTASELCREAKRRIFVLGEMLELGTESERLHEEIGAFAAGIGFSRLYAVGGESARKLAEGSKSGCGGVRYCRTEDWPELLETERRYFEDADLVLIKGSRGIRLEITAEILGARKEN